MANFWRLVQNENMKIYRRMRTYIMMGILAVIPIAITLIYVIVANGELWSNWKMMAVETSLLFSLVTIFTVIVSADSVAGEFTSGTIKLLLIRPWSRSMILLSKYVSLLLFAVALTVVLFAFTWLINTLALGYVSDASDLLTGSTPITGDNPWAYMSMYYLFKWLQLVVIVTFAFMLSSAFRSGGLAIGLSIFLLLSGSLITAMLSISNKAWVKYILFSNLDLTAYLDGNSPLEKFNMTIGFSLAVLAVYFIIFNLVSWLVFTKRDVAA